MHACMHACRCFARTACSFRVNRRLKLTRFRGEANTFAAASVVSAIHPVVCAFDGRRAPRSPATASRDCTAPWRAPVRPHGDTTGRPSRRHAVPRGRSRTSSRGWSVRGRCPARSLRRRRFAARNGSPAHDLSHVSGRLRRSAGRGGFSVVGEQMTKFGPRGPHGPPETAMRIDLSPL